VVAGDSIDIERLYRNQAEKKRELIVKEQKCLHRTCKRWQQSEKKESIKWNNITYL
jgi:hypothetical protein